MGQIGVYHPCFGQGGAESVCMHVLEALQEDHELTLMSLTDVDISTQNDYFETTVDTGIETTQLGTIGRLLDRHMNTWNRLVGRKFGRMHAALFNRFVKDQSEFDLIFSSHGEIATEYPSIQYIHYPWYNRSDLPRSIDPKSLPENAYNRLCHVLAAHDDDTIRRQRLLTNSKWTKNVLQDLYDVQPETVYPPLVSTNFDPRSWDERETGFVCVGRITPEKNVDRNIEIIDRLRARGHDVHLHVIGPVDSQSYAQRIEQLVDERPFVSLEGRLSREQLIEFICTHKYGIHGMEFEHFGIAVAELVAGGTIPFVPNSGGQKEIVGSESLTYESVPDAVEKGDAVLSDTARQRSVRASLATVEQQFEPDRFKDEIHGIVTEVLNER